MTLQHSLSKWWHENIGAHTCKLENVAEYKPVYKIRNLSWIVGLLVLSCIPMNLNFGRETLHVTLISSHILHPFKNKCKLFYYLPFLISAVLHLLYDLSVRYDWSFYVLNYLLKEYTSQISSIIAIHIYEKVSFYQQCIWMLIMQCISLRVNLISITVVKDTENLKKLFG